MIIIFFFAPQTTDISSLMIASIFSFQDSKPFLPPSNLPSRVPHFTGRQRECEDIRRHLTSKSTRIVSIWGSPGFGKTSVATEVGHQLQTGGLPVYFFSMRRLLSKAGLTMQLLSFFRRHSTKDQMPQRMSLEDELSLFLSNISGEFVIILDNADDLLESGAPNVKEDFINLLEVILSQFKNLTFLLTTRESLEFMNVHFEGHQAVRIGPLHESFSQTLVGGLLPKATASDCSNIAKLCGFVPLAMKLFCSSIAEDNAQPTQFLVIFKESIEDNLLELLDDSDYPSNLRLKFLFESSFQRLSLSDKKALVSLSVLSGDFNHSVAAAVMGVKTTLEAKKILHRLRKKSFLDYSFKPESFSMHKLILSFLRERGQDEMKEAMLNSKARLSAFYVSLFEQLNQQFLTGQSMQAFIDFYEEKQNIIQSLMESCSDPKTCDVAFGVLTKAEIFLDSLFWCEGKIIDKIYDHATKEAQAFGKSVFYSQLLVSLAFTELTWGIHGRSMTMLSEAEGLSLSVDDKRKILCYKGICQLVSGKIDDGAQNLQEALCLMSDSPEQRILSITALQILVTYFLFNKKKATSLEFCTKALHECRALGDTGLLVIPPVNNKDLTMIEADMPEPDVITTQPLRLETICVVSKATEMFSDYETKQAISKSVLRMSNQTKTQILPHSIGSWTFQRNINSTLKNVLNKPEEASKLCDTRISYHKKTLKQSGKVNTGDKVRPNKNLNLNLHQEELYKSYMDQGNTLLLVQNYPRAIQSFEYALNIARGLFKEEHPDTAESYFSIGVTQHALGNFSSALQTDQRALDIRVKLFREEHRDTAKSYFSIGVAQHALGNFSSALQSHQRALDIRVKLFGEEHPDTAESYFSIGVTQHALGNFSSALQSEQCTLDIRVKLFGEEHRDTAKSYFSIGVAQHALGNFSSALQSHQRALDTRVKLFGEEHPDTAKSYLNLGVTQHALGNFSSALQSKQRALDIRVKLFGEEHPDTAESYSSIGVTQHALGNFSSALQSKQRALDIRVKLFGEEHPDTAESYFSIGVTQHALGNFSSALQSYQCALDITVKLFGEEHPDTAESYFSIGVTQHALGNFSSALQSKQHALDIRVKLFGEEHPDTAKSYFSIGVTQHALGNFSSALQSYHRALDISVKLFGEEHRDTAESYFSIGVTQHALGNFSSALQSKQRALDITVKLFGEEHPDTAESYFSIGVTQHALGNFSSALQSKQRALDIRVKLFGEEHPDTAESYFSIGVAQHALGNFSSALQSCQRALDIRVKLFGEEHPDTAESYFSIGVTQHALGNFSSALQSDQGALDIRVKLFGEEHPDTAESYFSIGVTQHALGNFSSALQSKQRALDIRVKLFGEEHRDTAKSYFNLGVTQHALGNFSSALQSK